MPIPLKQELKCISKVVRLESALPRNDKDMLTWWYCGIFKNSEAESQPNVLVAFRTLLNSGNLSDEVTYRRIPLTALGQVRVGTVWRNGLCQAEVSLDTATFTVDYTEGNWNLTSFHQASGERSLPPYPRIIYPLKYAKDRNWLLQFTLPSGGKLIIPCLEFFTRCYGRSAELRRVLTAYSWEVSREKKLYAPIDEAEEPNKWKVKLRKRLVDSDVIFLAHAKYNTYTELAAKSIYSQIEANYDPADKQPAFIQVMPWFQGPAKLKAKGIWFDEGRSFLALQIDGCSQPDGVPIECDRENANNVLRPDESGEPGSAWAGTPERKHIKPPEIIDLTGDVEPDPHALSVEIEDPAFEELGEPRLVIKKIRERAQSSSGPRIKGTDALKFSSGEAHGSGHGVGYASIHSPPVLESQGVLRDMWNAILFVKKKRPDLIQSIEWFTFDDGYRHGAIPRLIELEPFKAEDNVDGATRKWLYMDVTSLQAVRGILVVRVLAHGRPVHILEIQRRPKKKKDKNGNTEDAEESFKGLVFVLDDHGEIQGWLKQLLSEVREVKGVVKKLVRNYPGSAATFKHSASGNDEVPCETAVLNALGKMGVDVSA